MKKERYSSRNVKAPTGATGKLPDKKKLYGTLGGVALAGAVAFGGGTLLAQPPKVIAQISQITPTASPSPTTTSQSGAQTTTAASPTSSAATVKPTTAGTTPASLTPATTTAATPSSTQTATGENEQSNGFDGEGGKGGSEHGGGLSGTISDISNNTLTLKRGSVVVIQATVDANTVYSLAGTTVKLSDLKVGETANIRTTTAADGTVTITAVEVVLTETGGTISALDASSLTLNRGNLPAIKVTPGTGVKIQDLGKTLNFSDLKAGQMVEVAGITNADGSLGAQIIQVVHDNLGGTVTAVSGNTITVQVNGRGQEGPENHGAGKGTGSSTATPAASTGTTKTISVDGSTVYTTGGQPSQLSGIQVGDRVEAAGTLSGDGTSLTALQVVVRLPEYQGQVTSVNGSTVVIQDRKTSRTIEVGSSTTYLNGTTAAALSDVKTGITIQVEGRVDAAGKMTASVVQLGSTGQGQGQNQDGFNGEFQGQGD